MAKCSAKSSSAAAPPAARPPRGHDQRAFGLGQDRRRPLDRVRRGRGRRRGDLPRRGAESKTVERLGERLARQAEVDRAARLAHSDREGAIDDRLHLLAVAQLVVPLDILAQHAGLVVHLLAPVDRQVATAEPATLGGRRAPRGEEDRDVVARGIEEAHQRVGHADVDVDHDRLGPAGDEIVAVRHADRGVLVRDDHRLGHGAAGLAAAHQGLDDRCEIGPRVGEQPVDAACLEQGEIGFGHGRALKLAVGHRSSFPMPASAARFGLQTLEAAPPCPARPCRAPPSWPLRIERSQSPVLDRR
jgi:hypothetical protein